jgi:hypothetical protein
VEHQFRIIGIAVGFNADVGDSPAFFLQLFFDCFFKRITGEVSRHQQFFVFNGFHDFVCAFEVIIIYATNLFQL